MRNETIVVGLSGGVDSSVAALLLKQQGYDVVGLYMKNWNEKEGEPCSSAQDYEDVRRVCSWLDIPHLSCDFSKEYWEDVFEDFLVAHRRGETPNPDVLCNREIKFKVFYEKALSLGAQKIATGHYCQTEGGGLYRGSDLNKDQTYFLHAVSATILKNVLFPVGHLPKDAVRAIAKEAGLPVHSKKDSTGICFIGEQKFRSFLTHFIAPRPGPFCLLDGTQVGEHLGMAFYTLGQRRGLGLGGEGSRWFVVDKDSKTNTVYVARGDHPRLFSQELWAEEPQWVRGEAPGLSFQGEAQIRHRQKGQACRVELQDGGRLRVFFETPQRAVTPGQFVVFYRHEECLGGARISGRAVTA